MHAAYNRGLDLDCAHGTASPTVPPVKIASLLVLVAVALGACSDEDERPAPAPAGERPAEPAVPDGGVPQGHGADDDGPAPDTGAPPPRERGSIVVPEADPTPPRPVVRLAGARATLERGAPRVLVPASAPIMVTVVGRDRDGGMGRARVAIKARLTCRSAGGELVTRPLVRYVPPPQVVRIRITPGTRTRTELRQTVTQRFDASACPGGTLERFRGQAWADTTNASGLDATSRHIRFASR
jgi:hypothetical protein